MSELKKLWFAKMQSPMKVTDAFVISKSIVYIWNYLIIKDMFYRKVPKTENIIGVWKVKKLK